MITDFYVRNLAKELMNSIRQLGPSNELEIIDDMISRLNKRKNQLGIETKNHDRYEIKNIGGTYIVYKNGRPLKSQYLTWDEAADSLPD